MEDDIFVLPQFHEITSDDSYQENSSNAENLDGINTNATSESYQNNGQKIFRNNLKRQASSSVCQPSANELDDNCFELDIEDEVVSEPKIRRSRRKRLKVADEPLDLSCEWRKCDFNSSNLDKFVIHVSYHIPELRLRFNEQNIEVYVCDWKGCEFETDDPKEIVRHVNFHSYHTKLKNIGSNLKTRWKLPTCQYSLDNSNILPDFPEQMECMWNSCGRLFTNIQTYHNHVAFHVNSLPPGNNLPTPLSCEWYMCSKLFYSRYHMLNHMKKHTHAKAVGCPDCGSVFCSNTKFFDHCLRKISSKVQNYQCSHCSRFYSTERILRDHMISHINHCKCPFCDMTCPYEYTLATHIRHKHMNEKPFKCQVCTYSCKTQSDLKKHLNSHETESLKCGVPNCGFFCKTNITLQRHYTKVHCNEQFKRFDCHVCHKQYNHGEVLTQHLIKKHDFHWPPGFSRFRYKKDEDGFYRLQTVRYESIEVTQAILNEESTTVSVNPHDESNFKLGKLQADSISAKVEISIISEANDKDKNPCSSEACHERLIAIEELDDKGNVVNMSTVVEEISSVPGEGFKIVAAAIQEN